MKLWILRPVGFSDIDLRGTSWDPWYDKAFGFVIRADNEDQARAIAQANGGDETRESRTAWTDATLSTCEPLSDEGEPGVVIRDFASA